ncbi:hypothetical protein [Azospirillum brasilense]|uniref:hypothetical protein n=1 Tax=Azospirillum brasilense TaxID=192 RepID=UPI001EDA8EBB|nr:hypothetical protein [Azospirillum brasilense]UKJ74255.1 hypothetical protein H1Q64_06630 [Azospirillum brasilense]
MTDAPNAPHGREYPYIAIASHPDARLIAFGLLWEDAGAEIEMLERQGAAPQKMDDALSRKMDITEAIGHATCSSPEGARILLRTAVDAAHIELGAELPHHWLLVKRALAALD